MIKPFEIQTSSDYKIDFLDLHNNLFIDVEKRITQQPIALSYGVKYGSHTPIVSYGNFMSIVGASKSMKTFLKSAFIAGYIGGKSSDYFSELRGHDTRDKIIIDIDTEQSKFHVQRASRRVVAMVGTVYPYYKPFALRSLSPRERVQFLEWLFNESEYSGNIGLCAVDGIADLVDNVNDLEKSNEIVQKLMKLTEIHNAAMITVLHANYDSIKPTGHLGSAVLKKCETVLNVSKQNNIVEVKPSYTRNIPIDEFSFCLNDNSLPEEINSNVIF